jgi:glutamate racemase
LHKDSSLPIGIFDSGVGGLTVVRRIHELLPCEDIIYLGDTARVPYGTKSPATVVRFACEDTAFLTERKVKTVVVACNTASAWALPTLEQEFDVPVFGVILPGAEAALKSTRNLRIGVIGTNATIRSQSYSRIIMASEKRAQVFDRACPLLVPLVEEGWIDHPVTRAVIKEYVGPLLVHQLDTLVLGCTHYPLLKETIQNIVGNDVTLVDSAECCALYLREQLRVLGLLSDQQGRQGEIRPFVTDEIERFTELCGRFLGLPAMPPSKVDLPAWPRLRV